MTPEELQADQHLLRNIAWALDVLKGSIFGAVTFYQVNQDGSETRYRLTLDEEDHK